MSSCGEKRGVGEIPEGSEGLGGSRMRDLMYTSTIYKHTKAYLGASGAYPVSRCLGHWSTLPSGARRC